MADMKLYKFITPSDPITFYAPDNDIAEAVAIYVGKSKAEIEAVDGSVTPSTLIVLGAAEGQVERLRKTMEERIAEVIAAGHTFAVCTPGERGIYDDYTNNGRDPEKIAKWDAVHRSSISNWCGFARGLKIRARK